MDFVLLGIALVAVPVVGAVVFYNRLVGLRQLVRNAWADVDVYLKRRSDLVPQIANAVKAYAAHEQALLTAVSESRSQAMASGNDLGRRAEAEGALGHGLARIMALKEAYPDLKASENFLGLQNDLRDTEKLIANARQYYNACVRELNTTIEAFPSNLIAGLAGVKHQSFFELETLEERDSPDLGRPLAVEEDLDVQENA